jgi:hypothetical protein
MGKDFYTHDELADCPRWDSVMWLPEATRDEWSNGWRTIRD